MVMHEQFVYSGPLMHVVSFLNFGLIQYGRHTANFGHCQDCPFRDQISVLNNATWTWSCMNIVVSGPFARSILKFWSKMAARWLITFYILNIRKSFQGFP